jgi:hypothetical protein
MNFYDHFQVAAQETLMAQTQQGQIGSGGGGTSGLDGVDDAVNNTGSDLMNSLQGWGLSIAGVMVIVVGLIGFFGSKGIGGIFKEFAKPIVIVLLITLAPSAINLVSNVNLLG